ncbi:hypothetical protein [Brachybacterium epidermidis]|uniref:hypothetical protein n=1 Tax=Brachybacterium epidermidis TaxID=2781983 RepID=UPI00398F27E9
MSARSKAHCHRDEVGEVLAVHSDRPNPLVAGIFVLAWAVFSGLTLINPGENALFINGPIATFALIFGLVLLCISGERLAVCERGLVIGSVAPGLRPYVVRYEQIVPGSVVPVTGARKYGRETGHSGFPQSTVPRSAWTGRGVHFAGPRRRRRGATTRCSPRCRTPTPVHRRALGIVRRHQFHPASRSVR